MKLKHLYDEIAGAMNGSAEYAGSRHRDVLDLLADTTMFLNPGSQRKSWKLYRPRIGLLEDNAMVLALYASGITVPNGEELTGITLFPVPCAVDQSAASLDLNGRVTAVYDHRDGYSSFSEWNSYRSSVAKSREGILEDLLVAPFEFDASRGLSGVEIAVRYLLETPTGFPIGYDFSD